MRTAKEHDIISHIKFNTTVERCDWQEKEGTWRVTTFEGTVYSCNVLVHAGGMLNHPRYPDIPGLDTFKGTRVHPARWNLTMEDLESKRVSVIGTGCSATQIVPEIIDKVKSLTLFQRSPPWVCPREAFGAPLAQGYFARFWDAVERARSITMV